MKALAVLFALFLPFVSAIAVDLDCPLSVAVNEEFSCEVSSSEVEGMYDLKVELKEGGKTVARIFDDSKDAWASSYYYLKEFISEAGSQTIKLKIESAGEFEGVVKVRGSSAQEVGRFKITVGEEDSREENEEVTEENSASSDDEEEAARELTEVQQPIVLGEISLGAAEKDVVEPELVYESKNARILRFAPYALSLLLLVVIMGLLRER